MKVKHEDKVKLWTWCGWEVYKSNPFTKGWVEPSSSNVFECLPEVTLDNLYKYIVPKLLKENLAMDMITRNKYNEAFIHNAHMAIRSTGDNLTEAVFKASIRLIDELQKKEQPKQNPCNKDKVVQVIESGYLCPVCAEWFSYEVGHNFRHG
jgi:hypothetical protein